MLRRSFLGLWLVLLLLVSQQGAALHEISHLADLPISGQKQDKAPHLGFCDKCVAYAEVGDALHSTPQALSPPIGRFATPQDYAQRAFILNTYHYSARAPPVFA